MWIGENPPRAAEAPWWAQGRGGAPSYVGWVVHTQKTAQVPVQA
jgi:hypothetical protein